MALVTPIDDPPIQGQKYMVVSMVSPNNDHNKAPVPAFKVKFVAETIEECKTMAKRWRDSGEELQDQYLGQIGKWLPFIDDVTQLDKIDYYHEQLTEFIMGQKERDKQAKQYFDERVNQSIANAQNPKTRDAVIIRHEIHQMENHLKSLKNQIIELEDQLMSMPSEVQIESKESFTNLMKTDGVQSLELD
jgi:hypothetical protein